MATAQTLFETFERDLTRSVELVADVQRLRLPPEIGGKFRALPYLQLALIAELAFLRSFITWESFLEEIFICYGCGREACDGTRFTTFVAPPNEQHLREMIVGERRAYASWSVVDDVRRRATIFFSGGEPFVPVLDSASTALKDMVVVRNRIAHRSPSASKKFLSLVQQRHGTVQPGMSPGRFLLREGTDQSMRRLDEYSEVLRLAAKQLAGVTS
jgi:hypothetical protein